MPLDLLWEKTFHDFSSFLPSKKTTYTIHIYLYTYISIRGISIYITHTYLPTSLFLDLFIHLCIGGINFHPSTGFVCLCSLTCISLIILLHHPEFFLSDSSESVYEGEQKESVLRIVRLPSRSLISIMTGRKREGEKLKENKELGGQFGQLSCLCLFFERKREVIVSVLDWRCASRCLSLCNLVIWTGFTLCDFTQRVASTESI